MAQGLLWNLSLRGAGDRAGPCFVAKKAPRAAHRALLWVWKIFLLWIWYWQDCLVDHRKVTLSRATQANELATATSLQRSKVARTPATLVPHGTTIVDYNIIISNAHASRSIFGSSLSHELGLLFTAFALRGPKFRSPSESSQAMEGSSNLYASCGCDKRETSTRDHPNGPGSSYHERLYMKHTHFGQDLCTCRTGALDWTNWLPTPCFAYTNDPIRALLWLSRKPDFLLQAALFQILPSISVGLRFIT